jgi:filamentous hemagglutinin
VVNKAVNSASAYNAYVRSTYPTVNLNAETQGLGGVVSLEDTSVTWGKGIAGQGKPFEQFVQNNLPSGSIDLNSIKNNFSTFDHMTPDGTAISTKTMDTIGSSTYRNPDAIMNTLNGYVDQMANFTGDGKGTIQITSNMISSKQMQLGIPYDTTADQMAAIARSIQYASEKGIQIVVTKIH